MEPYDGLGHRLSAMRGSGARPPTLKRSPGLAIAGQGRHAFACSFSPVKTMAGSHKKKDNGRFITFRLHMGNASGGREAHTEWRMLTSQFSSLFPLKILFFFQRGCFRTFSKDPVAVLYRSVQPIFWSKRMDICHI